MLQITVSELIMQGFVLQILQGVHYRLQFSYQAVKKFLKPSQSTIFGKRIPGSW